MTPAVRPRHGPKPPPGRRATRWALRSVMVRGELGLVLAGHWSRRRS